MAQRYKESGYLQNQKIPINSASIFLQIKNPETDSYNSPYSGSFS